LTEWQAYAEIDPFGSRRADLQAASIVWMLATVNAKKGAKFSLEDFLLEFKDQEDEAEEVIIDPGMMKHQLKMLFGGRGG